MSESEQPKLRPTDDAADVDNIEGIIAEHRLRIAGKPGIAGLLSNGRAFLLAVFASLGGLVYGYNQGVFSGVQGFHSFSTVTGIVKIQDQPTLQGLLTSILELGAWVGSLLNGYLADRLGRKGAVMVAVVVFVVGVIVQATTHGGNWHSVLGGRFVTGLGVGSLSMVVPLYNAELSPPEIRGSLVALQQLAITFGIMISYWITYGTQFIGGTGAGQSQAAWLIPICIQVLPALVLAAGMIIFMPSSPRWLMNVGREEDCRAVLADLRRLPPNHDLIQMEFLEIKAQQLFEQEIDAKRYGDKSGISLGVARYVSMVTHPPTFRRIAVACLIMTFQQWTGINFILYYAPFIFQTLNLTSNTTSLLASGVVGIVMFLATIPAVLFVDQIGRKPVLVSGAIIMGICHFIVAAMLGQYSSTNFAGHAGAGWVAVVFIWIFSIAFGYSWGPCAWIVVAEIFPLGNRARGISIGASSNWLNNFAVGISTPNFVSSAGFGAYIFLGLMCILGAAYVYFFTPETKGKSLEEIDQVFGDTSGTAKEEKKVLQRIMREIGLLALALGTAEEKPEIDHIE